MYSKDTSRHMHRQDIFRLPTRKYISFQDCAWSIKVIASGLVFSPPSLPFPFPFSKKCLHFIRLKSISVLLFHDYGWDIPRYHRLCNTIRQDILSSWFCLYDTTHKRNISYYNIDSYSSFKIRFFSYYNMLLKIVHHINYTRWWGIGTMRINYIGLHHWLY